jgi:hypothetical protein
MSFLSEFGDYIRKQKNLLKTDPDFGRKSWTVETIVSERKNGVSYSDLPTEFFEELPAINHQYDFYLLLYVYSNAADEPADYENAKRICRRVLDETPPDIIKDVLDDVKCDLLFYMIMSDDDRKAITELYDEMKEHIFAKAFLDSRTDDETLMLTAGYTLFLFAYNSIILNDEEAADEAHKVGFKNAARVKRKNFFAEYERDIKRVKDKAESLIKAKASGESL